MRQSRKKPVQRYCGLFLLSLVNSNWNGYEIRKKLSIIFKCKPIDNLIEKLTENDELNGIRNETLFPSIYCRIIINSYHIENFDWISK